jgi:crotonobetaine/carnitine-CoA ligase
MIPPKDPPALRTLGAMLARNAERDGDRPFILDERGELTRGGAFDLARGMSGAFAALGVEKGDPVVVMLDNRREFLASWFGLALAGSLEVPANPDYVGERLLHIFNHSRAATAVVEGRHLARIDELADQLPDLRRVIVVEEGRSERFETIAFEDLDVDPAAAPDRSIRFSDPVAVMYTSGSTGPAKGALLPHGQHYINGWQPASVFGLGEEDRLYVCLPLHHNMAQGYGIWPAIVNGASVRLARRFDRATFWDDVRDSGSTILTFVGAMLVLLAKQTGGDDENPLRLGFGVPIPADLHEAFERRFDLELVHGYGSTEATIVAWNHGPDRKVGAAGRVLDDFDVRLVDEDDMPVPRGEVGEICIRPAEPYSTYVGYHRDSERTTRAFRNLWLHSGDRGRLDEDGLLWFADRIDDVIRRAGEFVSSSEVEHAVLSHPEVTLVAAYGVESDLIEQEVMVSVVRQPGSGLTAAELWAWCRERLPKFAVPRYVTFQAELPMTPTGKIEKYRLRERGVMPDTEDFRAQRKVTG